MNELVGQFVRLGQQLADESNAAADLWTWLPSHKIAEQYHGDYAIEVCPSVKDILTEAAMYIAHLKHPERDLTPEEKEWFSNCPCALGRHIDGEKSSD